MPQALFLNGVYKTVLDEIIHSQRNKPDLICFLQPYSSEKIKLLSEKRPTTTNSITVYISTTADLGNVTHVANIVGWQNKSDISSERLNKLDNHVQKYQPSEERIYMSSPSRKPCTNLISVLNVKQLANSFSVSNLVKVHDGSALKVRKRAGGWSNVYELPSWVGTSETAVKEQLDLELEQGIDKSRQIGSEARRKRMANADKMPQQVQVLSFAYRRNPDVIVEVMIRAQGNCERCKSPAPFLRAKDNAPYLEIHHWTPLSEGGEDSTENAGALCPNCHREMHFGGGMIHAKIS